MITDSYHRKHDYLRISLTDVCNLRCAYCMPEEEYHFMPTEKLMSPEEIGSIAAIFVELGVKRIRLTGGEPLARKDFADIVQRLSVLPVELTMTTNATLLHRHLETLMSAGMRSLNISLDTLSAEKFFRLTRRDKHAQIMQNIGEAIQKGLHIKINMVVMKGVNDDEVLDFIAWTKNAPVEIRFIEFMPFTGNHWTGAQVFSQQEILDLVGAHYAVEALPREPQATSQPFSIAGHTGSFAIIGTMSAPFCAGCNRMRLTADGRMKNCLFSTGETDLLTALREGRSIIPLIEKNVLDKAEKLGGQFGDKPFEELEGEQLINRTMISIGG